MSTDDRMSELLAEAHHTTVTSDASGDLLTDMSKQCCDVLDIAVAYVLLVGRNGQLEVVAWSHGADRHAALFALQTGQGPGPDCYTTNQPVAVCNLAADGANERWPIFTPAARTAGFRGAGAIPMRLGQGAIGAVGLLSYEPTPPAPKALRTAQALADAASRAVLDVVVADDTVLEQPISQALHARVLIEQAIGFISERDHIGIDEATTWLRESARVHNRRLVDIAATIVAGTPPIARRAFASAPKLDVPLPSSTEAPSIACQALDAWLTPQGASHRLSHDARLIVSELVTRATTLGLTTSTLQATNGGGVLRIEIHNQDPTFALTTLTADGSSEFGLPNVQYLSHKWGCITHETGTLIWSEIH